MRLSKDGQLDIAGWPVLLPVGPGCLLGHASEGHIEILGAHRFQNQLFMLSALPIDIELSDVAGQSGVAAPVPVVSSDRLGHVLGIGSGVVFTVFPQWSVEAVAVSLTPDNVQVQVMMQISRGFSPTQCSCHDENLRLKVKIEDSRIGRG